MGCRNTEHETIYIYIYLYLLYIYIYIYYIYIYIIYTHIYIYIHTYTHIYIYIYMQNFSESSICSQPGAQRCSKSSVRLEVTDKIGLPLSYANGIYQRAELGAELATWRGGSGCSQACVRWGY